MQRNALEVWNEIPNEYKKFVKEVLQKRNKKSSSQYPRNWRFLLEAQWDNVKIQTQQNWTNLNQCYNMFRTLRNSRTFFPLQVNICHFLFFSFSCVSFCLFIYISSIHFCFISSVLKLSKLRKKNWPTSTGICYLQVKGISCKCVWK